MAKPFVTSVPVDLYYRGQNGEVQECYLEAPGGERLPVDTSVCERIPQKYWFTPRWRKGEKLFEDLTFALTLRTPEGGVGGCMLAAYNTERGVLRKVTDLPPEVCEALPEGERIRKRTWDELQRAGSTMNRDLIQPVLETGELWWRAERAEMGLAPEL